MDEAWSFVAKKEKNCDEDEPEDRVRGDCWDDVLFDPEYAGWWWRSSQGSGRPNRSRSWSNDVKGRLDGQAPALITTDEYSAYEGTILEAFGEGGGAAADRAAGAAAEVPTRCRRWG